MRCPKCSGKLLVVDNVHNRAENETYREKTCVNCGHTFYTVEYEVIENKRFIYDWDSNHR